MSNTYVTKTTHELVPGDVVQSYGARIRVNEILVSEMHPKTGRGGECRYSRGTVLNLDDPECSDWIAGWARKDGHWTIQGNALAEWCVESVPVVTAEQAISALELLDRLRQPAGKLERGDRVVYLSYGHYVQAVIESVTVDPQANRDWMRVETVDGEVWQCSPLNTRCLVVQS